MYPITINLIPMLFTLATGFGVMVHDTQIDRAAVNAFNTPVALVSYTGNTTNPELRLNDQLHTETTTVEHTLRTLSGLEPRLQSRFTDEKKYITPKKVALNTTNGGVFDLT